MQAMQSPRHTTRKTMMGLESQFLIGEIGISSHVAYLSKRMTKTFEFCIPTRGTKVPKSRTGFTRSSTKVPATAGARWRPCPPDHQGRPCRLPAWTSRYPWIVEAALKNRHKQFAIDGEAVVLGVDGVADFNALHCWLRSPARSRPCRTVLSTSS